MSSNLIWSTEYCVGCYWYFECDTLYCRPVPTLYLAGYLVLVYCNAYMNWCKRMRYINRLRKMRVGMWIWRGLAIGISMFIWPWIDIYISFLLLEKVLKTSAVQSIWIIGHIAKQTLSEKYPGKQIVFFSFILNLDQNNGHAWPVCFKFLIQIN